jgi:hypothetical protein
MLFRNKTNVSRNHHVVPEQKNHTIESSCCSGTKEAQYQIIMLFRNKTNVSRNHHVVPEQKNHSSNRHVPEQNKRSNETSCCSGIKQTYPEIVMSFRNKRITLSNHHVVPEQKKHSIKSSCCSKTKQTYQEIMMLFRK